MTLADPFAAVADIQRAYALREVPTALADDDDMFDDRNPRALDHYSDVGRQALSLVLRSMALCGTESVGSLLDLPCGYGRVLRHLVTAFPAAVAYAGEIGGAKTAFCAEQLGAVPVQSSTDLASVHFDRTFDLVWSGSLLTHLPQPAFVDALDLFSRSLAPGGIALVTVHGRNAQVMHRGDGDFDPVRLDRAVLHYESDGFGYVDYDGVDGYGISMVRPSVVVAHVERDPSLSLRAYVDRGWDDRQDVPVVESCPCTTGGRAWADVPAVRPPANTHRRLVDIEPRATGTVEANGITIAYETFGDPTGVPVLLIMGLGAQMIRGRTRSARPSSPVATSSSGSTTAIAGSPPT